MQDSISKMHAHVLRHRRSRQRVALLSNSLAFFLFFIAISHAPTLSRAQCSTTTVGCYPPVANLAIGRTLQTDSQCSENDTFCTQGTPDCSNVCRTSINSIASINDDSTDTMWISDIGTGNHNVTLQLDFQEPVLFDRMRMIWGSSRPLSMVLERSVDGGASWEAYRFYSTSCMSNFQMVPLNTFPPVEFPSTTAVCTASQSALLPYTDGEVTFGTSEHLSPGSSISDSIAYMQMTNLRVRLFGQFNLGSSDYQYYSVKEWVVNGTCMCNGHAAMCAPANNESLASNKVYSGCACEHDTEGVHCERCRTGFNAVQWAAGTDTDANACQPCDCNGHAEDCMSENPEEGTQCLDCAHNTEGNNCESCRSGYYENAAVLFSDPNICIDCSCDEAGITDGGDCSDSGQCSCKANVTGLQCSECVSGYWNLTTGNEYGCQECECDPRGTLLSTGDPPVPLCDQLTGACQCKDNVGGDPCDICDDGYYSLDDGCLPCGCNVAASTSPVCDKDSPDGQCPCLPNVDTPTCTIPLPGYYFRYLDHLLFEAEDAEISEGVTRLYPEPRSGVVYTGRGLIEFPASGTAVFYVQVPRDYRYEIILRLQPPSTVDALNVVIESQSPVERDLNCSPVPNTTTSSFLLPFLLTPAAHVVIDTVCLQAGVVYSVRIEHLDVQRSDWMLDSLLLLPDFSSESAYYAQLVADGDAILLEECLPRPTSQSGVREECRDIAFALSVEFYGQVFECSCSGSEGADDSVVCATYGGQCSCLEGVTGLQCDMCLNGWYNLSSTGCKECGCDAEGSTSAVCDMNTGQCDCQPYVEGLTCDTCSMGYFNLTSSGCSECNCSEFSTSAQCSEQGLCPCTGGVGGSRCDQCLVGYYNISTTGCTECNCSSIGVRSSSNECDATTGQCPCISNTVTRDCSQCPVGHFETNNPDTDACIECVCSMRSSVCSDDSTSYQAAACQSNFQQLCAQSPLTCNDDWELLTASGQSAAPYGPSDAAGLGYILLMNDSPMLHAPSKFLGNQRSSYGLYFTILVSLPTTAGLKDTTLVILEYGDVTLVGIFPPPDMQQESSSLNIILTYTIPLVEDYWYVNSSTGPPATFFEFYSALTNITQLSFSAEFRQDFIEFVYIQSVSLQTRLPLGAPVTDGLVLLNTSFPTELCICPPEYAGTSCELCARGHARPSGNIAHPCIPCDCNNLTLDCDVDTGVCIGCTGNSEGDSCERCQTGYYGDPTRGIPCLACQCPSSERSFSPTCFLDSDLNPTCDNCSLGYTGRSCEQCMDGFYGNPLIGQCITCECNGNVDPGLGPVCDTTTGRCLNCLNNTQGFECQFCQPRYYGDPPSGLPCRPCGCHPNGTLGDCSSVFGVCTCASESVLGELCDECRDGYWGLSQGLPCIPCDCCTNGSNSHICDKDTGQCDCHENVGSEEDGKCCTCTPGYFDFTPDGCRECGCSELSASEECDIVTGQCQCEEGAVGTKCDDCAFGFTGTVPECTECHPCFLQWYNKIQDISAEVAILQNRAVSLVDGYYNGYTVESIEAHVQALLGQLASTNATLQAISLSPSTIQQLEDILSEIHETLAEMDGLTRDTEQQLATAEQMLATVAEFDGTVNETTVNDLVQQISFYNSTIASLVSSAQLLLNELVADQTQAHVVWVNISAEERSIHELLENVSLAEDRISTVESLVAQFEQRREDLRSNLTDLSVEALSLGDRLAALNDTLRSASIDSSDAYSSVDELRSNLTALRSQTDYVLNLTRHLNTSIETTSAASQTLEENTRELLDQLNTTQQSAQDLSDDVTSGLYHVEELIVRLDTTKTQALRVFDISLPPLDYVQELAISVNESILPVEHVEEIAANATASLEAAQQALDLANNASETVRLTQSLIDQLTSDVNSTKTTQQRVEETLSQLTQTVSMFTQQLDQAIMNSVAVNQTSSQVRGVVENASRVVDSTAQYATQLLSRSQLLESQVSEREQRILINANVSNEIVNEFSALQAEANTRHMESLMSLENATDILTSAQQLHNSTGHATVQQLQELLSEYGREREAISDLRELASSLEAELRNLTLTFTQAAQTLSDCYQTP